jgi:malate dehydrogenase
MNAKVSVLGAGNVGATIAQLIAYEGFADVVLYDIVQGMPQGKALDIAEACPLWGSAVSVTGTNSYDDTSGSDILVITAGLPRKPGMSRDDLLHANSDIMQQVVSGTAQLSPEGIIIVVSNPMDVMAQIAWNVSGFDHKKVIGMGGILDSSRFRTFVSMELGVSPEDIEALVLGGHGDQMVPLPGFTTVKGIPITKLLSEDRVQELIKRTRNGGAEIVSLLKTGSAFYAPAASSVQMVKSILHDEKRLLPCAALLKSEYGINDLYVGVPVILGRNGIEKIVELALNEEEKAQFNASAASVKSLFEIAFKK